MLYQVFNGSIPVFGESPANPVCYNGAERQALVPQGCPQSVNGCRFHFKIRDPVLAKRKIGQCIVQMGQGQAQSKHPSLWAIKTGTSNSNAVVCIFSEHFQQRSAAPENIGIRKMVVELGLRNK